MSDFFSDEMKKEIIKLFEIQYKEKGVGNTLANTRIAIQSIEEVIKDLNNRLVDTDKNVDEMETLVAETMLKLMPNFNLKISKEIKKHLVTIAEYVIKTFKEKD
jgi:lipid A disaccharide synthetase